ncbi:MAG: 2,3-bisphosphoglycerate-dependent phosphoglycerate mutase [Candidatus Anoxychlamydiales bacterium]|nr:2,3-bisphosphoglycerate-dependent phosphoglycerate mutase [Candidatus Anoxychlamydiales bacterium]
MAKLILMRHGESIWNQKNLFTGWVDVPLSEKGVFEAIEGGKKIKNIPIDIAFTSELIRAQTTAVLAMLNHSSKKTLVFDHSNNRKLKKMGYINSEKAKEATILMYHSWRLNERMYGDLQGQNKDEAREKFGKEQVHIWRRSYDTAPPNGESLKQTAKRALPYFKKEIFPYIEKNKNVFISAHGNSLRAIIMFLENLSKDEVVKLEIPTGDPIVYEYIDGRWVKESI